MTETSSFDGTTETSMTKRFMDEFKKQLSPRYILRFAVRRVFLKLLR
jgi:hypothetical protein